MIMSESQRSSINLRILHPSGSWTHGDSRLSKAKRAQHRVSFLWKFGQRWNNMLTRCDITSGYFLCSQQKKVESGTFYLLVQDLTRWLVWTIRLSITRMDVMETGDLPSGGCDTGHTCLRVSFTLKPFRAVRPLKADPRLQHPTAAWLGCLSAQRVYVGCGCHGNCIC